MWSEPNRDLLQRVRYGSAECVYGPATAGWEDVDHLEMATLSWVHWFNEDRLHSHCGDIPPAEFETAFYAAQQTSQSMVGNQ